MYVLALSDYKQHAAAAGYKPAPQLGQLGNESFQNALNRHWTYVYFTNGVFCFHVSFLCFNLLIINTFEG